MVYYTQLQLVVINTFSIIIVRSFATQVIPVGELCFADNSTGVCDINAVCLDDGGGIYTCDCQKGFKQKNGTCLQVHFPGDHCSDGKVDICIDSYCDTFFHKCLCKGAFQNVNRTCIKELYLHDKCDPKNLTMGVCSMNTVCNATQDSGYICSCQEGFIMKFDQCQMKAGASEICEETIDCQTGLECVDFKCNFVLNVGESCELDLASGACPAGSRCTIEKDEETVCACVKGYYEKKRKCIKSKLLPIGSLCTTNKSNGICDDSAACVNVGNGTLICQCKTGWELEKNSCIKLIGIGDACKDDGSTGRCGYGSVCEDDGNEHLKCQCVTGSHNKNGTCAEKIGLGEACQQDQYTGHCNDDAYCKQTTHGVFRCMCKTGLTQRNSKCFNIIPAGHGCFTNDSSGICDSNTSCVDSGNGTFMCLCQNGLQLINGTCDIVIPVGQLCYLDGSTGVCSPNSVCIDRGDGLQLCTCVNGLVQQNNTCVKSTPPTTKHQTTITTTSAERHTTEQQLTTPATPGQQLGEPCYVLDAKEPCVTPDSECNTFTHVCECIGGLYPENGTCTDKIPLGGQCFNGACTIDKSHCVNVSGKGYVCICMDGYHQQNDTCLKGSGMGGYCTDLITCVTGLVCTNAKCNKGLHYGDFCYPDNSTGVCIDLHTKCDDGGEEIFICDCTNGYTVDNGHCNAITTSIQNIPSTNTATITAESTASTTTEKQTTIIKPSTTSHVTSKKSYLTTVGPSLPRRTTESVNSYTRPKVTISHKKKPPPTSSELSTGDIAGISIGVIATIIFLLVLTWFVLRPRFRHINQDESRLIVRDTGYPMTENVAP